MRDGDPDGARRFPDNDSTLELRAIATRAFAQSDEYSRGLLRGQLISEEFREAEPR
jgi:hypothetical protein